MGNFINFEKENPHSVIPKLIIYGTDFKPKYTFYFYYVKSPKLDELFSNQVYIDKNSKLGFLNFLDEELYRPFLKNVLKNILKLTLTHDLLVKYYPSIFDKEQLSIMGESSFDSSLRIQIVDHNNTNPSIYDNIHITHPYDKENRLREVLYNGIYVEVPKDLENKRLDDFLKILDSHGITSERYICNKLII
jgi:hypothetical protein